MVEAKKNAIKWFWMQFIPIFGIFISLSGRAWISYKFYLFVKYKGNVRLNPISAFALLYNFCAGLIIIAPFFGGMLVGSGKIREVVGLNEALSL